MHRPYVVRAVGFRFWEVEEIIAGPSAYPFDQAEVVKYKAGNTISMR
jgi:hypothetical protein